MKRNSTPASMAAAQLDAWLDTIRCPGGYGGPVAHWWQQSLLYTGPGLDWRYEGIIAGYLQLWQQSGDQQWLSKACRAGKDLLAGQFPEGHFSASAFEINLASAGTPHEAACDVGLLLLAKALQEQSDPGWRKFSAAAERNLHKFYVGRLWDAQTQSITDSPVHRSFVPNKAATACEAFFLLAEVAGDEYLVEKYALPTLDRIIQHQVRESGPLHGAIAQNSFGSQIISKYFPIYIARCIPALVRGSQWSGDDRYVDAALQAMDFIVRWEYADGSFPTVIYGNRRVNRFPSWIAALADILRMKDLLEPYGFDFDMNASFERLISGCDPSGGVQTATGFAAQAGGSPSSLPDVRDVLHVAGWCDKAFRYLSAHAGPDLPAGNPGLFEAECTFRGRVFHLVETSELLDVSCGLSLCYRWRKGESWPDVASAEFWLR